MISNNKLKIISVLSSAMLWFYVIAVVNPESNSSIEDLTVNISNTVELAENNLILASDSKPTINLTLEGKISDLRKLKRENIRASIEIENPSEGQNEATVHVSTPNGIKYVLDTETIVVQLEKIISKEHTIYLELPSDKNSEDYNILTNLNEVKVSGPRSVINRVNKVIATVKEENFDINKNIGVQLKAVDYNGDIVENATFENSIIQIKLNKIEQKEVVIEPVFKTPIDNNTLVNPHKIIIYGEASALENIDKITTKPIDVKELNNKNELEVEFELPEGVSTIKKPFNDVSPENKVIISLNK